MSHNIFTILEPVLPIFCENSNVQSIETNLCCGVLIFFAFRVGITYVGEIFFEVDITAKPTVVMSVRHGIIPAEMAVTHNPLTDRLPKHDGHLAEYWRY
jgi:hypothetical protein